MSEIKIFKKIIKNVANGVDFADDWGYSSICNQLKSKASGGNKKAEIDAEN
ncbi:MAG TPA: hypothetical protein VLG50_04385 [Candidatus Saccharimonadales bacterium]|nr:hypothetical protein [Candidatus Saccharimonadales bacterium]